MHDSQVLDTVLRDAEVSGKTVWADSAYRSDEQEQSLAGSQHESQIHERAYRNKPDEGDGNQQYGQVAGTRPCRARLWLPDKQHGRHLLAQHWRCACAVGVGLMNLTYNLARIEVLIRLKVFDFDRIAAPKIQGAA